MKHLGFVMSKRSAGRGTELTEKVSTKPKNVSLNDAL